MLLERAGAILAWYQRDIDVILPSFPELILQFTKYHLRLSTKDCVRLWKNNKKLWVNVLDLANLWMLKDCSKLVTFFVYPFLIVFGVPIKIMSSLKRNEVMIYNLHPFHHRVILIWESPKKWQEKLLKCSLSNERSFTIVYKLWRGYQNLVIKS